MLSSTTSDPLSQPIDDQIDGITLNFNQVLADLVENDQPLVAIAAAYKLTLRQLLIWAAQPPVRALLDAADELAQRRAAHKAADARQLAIQVLAEQCRVLHQTTRDRDIASRAARALLRISEPANRTKAPPRQRPTADLTDPIRRVRHPAPTPDSTAEPRTRSIPAAQGEVLQIPIYRFRPPPHAPSPHTPLPITLSPHTPSPHTDPPRNGDHEPQDPHARDP